MNDKFSKKTIINNHIIFSHSNNDFDFRTFLIRTYFILLILIIIVIFILFASFNDFQDSFYVTLIVLSKLIIPAIVPIILITFGLNWVLNKIFTTSKFIFNDTQIIYIYKPPLVLESLLKINIEDHKILQIAQVQHTENEGIYMYISYKFTASSTNSSFNTYHSTISYTKVNKSYQYKPNDFNIQILKNGELIYNEQLNIFENLYFSNPNNIEINKLDQFIQIAINNSLSHIL